MKTRMRMINIVLAIVTVFSFAIVQVNAESNPLRDVYFGEQHLHTAASPDAFAVGTRGTWEDAYR